MANLKKHKALPPAVLADLQAATTAANGEEAAVGNTYIRYTGSYGYQICRITAIKQDLVYKEKDKKEPVAVIVYDETRHWDGSKWKAGGEKRASEFFDEDTYLFTGSVADWMAKAVDMIEKQDFDAISDKTEQIKENTLVAPNSKPQLLAMQAEMTAKRNAVGLLRSFVGREMERRKQELDEVRERLGGILAEFNEKIEKIGKVIAIIELYLGINEEIVQIAEGAKASPDTPITFRQQILFMDEEVGDPADGGWDYRDIDGFDRWLIKDDRYKTLVPEEKCIVVFQPRRDGNEKFYHDDPRVNAFMNEDNFKTYFLIRNGNSLFRIWAKISVGERLFPLRKEFEKILSKIHDYQKKGKDWNKREIKDLENKMHGYQKRAYMLQGLIDRTEVFHPIAKPVSMFNMEAAGGLIQFIYDDELAFPTGKKMFWDFHRHINSKIQRGSRVIHTGQYTTDGSYVNRENYSGCWFKYYYNKNYPKLPEEGLYIVDSKFEIQTEKLPYYYADELEAKGLLIERIKKTPPNESYDAEYVEYDTNEYLPPENFKLVTHKRLEFPYTDKYEDYIETFKCKFQKEIFFIRYNPKDEVRSGWGDWEGHTRKNNLSFKIEPRDKYIFNYDQISLEDIDFYLNSRIDRPNYAHMMPILRIWKKHRLEELKWEKEFVEFIKRRAQQKKLAAKQNVDLDKIIWKAIDWWKHKNIWKRPITKDDTLALRMIERRIFSQESIKKNFVKA